MYLNNDNLRFWRWIQHKSHTHKLEQKAHQMSPTAEGMRGAFWKERLVKYGEGFRKYTHQGCSTKRNQDIGLFQSECHYQKEI